MKFILSISLTAIIATSLSAAETNDIILSDLISGIISSEKDETLKNNLIEIASSVQDTYSDLFNKLSTGGKIRIFIDPAHGKVRNNDSMEWQGALTWRKSTTGVPEELYSIPLARKFYKLASENPFIEIVSFPDYMDMLTGKSETYNDVSFDDSVDEALKSGSFLIISEHLNNISPISKADGFVNIPGLHVTCNQWRTPFLSYVSGVYRGYFTYYNMYDITGSSRAIGEEFRNNMTRKGHIPNSWDNGVVGDDRFSLYVNFPISVIFESGFISNPVEEQLLKDDRFQNDIVESQYSAILSTIRSSFGVDISGTRPEQI
ncbi:MAG TPA: N-acetylmuramoyl-L-alanine amidase, partial [Spirochaetota bacterium]|nr:N-acetylmuramoyl-L-alanine amidase [Spirochaetota bacterium]